MEDIYKQIKNDEIQIEQTKPFNLGECVKRVRRFQKDFQLHKNNSDASNNMIKQYCPSDQPLDPSNLASPGEEFHNFRSNYRPRKKNLSTEEINELQTLQYVYTEKANRAFNTSMNKVLTERSRNASRAPPESAKTKIKASKAPETIAKPARKASNSRKLSKRPNLRARDYFIIQDPVNNPKKADLVTGEDFIVTIQVFLPFHYTQQDGKTLRLTKIQAEIEILGSQTLLDLREVIFCIEDFKSLDGDVSDKPQEPSGRIYKECYPSSMFFINDTFYADYTKTTDYSCVVKEWAQAQNIPLNKKTKDMAKTRIGDLTLKLNHFYVFQHLGDCEHLILFTGSRLLDAFRNSMCSSDYPRFKKIIKVQGNHCSMCAKGYPSWMVVGFSRLPSQYAYLCKICFKNYCYIGDKKIGSFEAYHFIDRRALSHI
ncbi:hypothetical protein LSTR_LSTR006219 [Laodelphax striatellus]|uniref:snRNA-activating protein complex subunit 3 n=1 Tax=Laodelphax striatellus TaxID=195883 RepID=A0A482XQN3_LAOST|nr:hypothetical protein LSTR_LSTR006219 [Laodelphax striatellus]